MCHEIVGNLKIYDIRRMCKKLAYWLHIAQFLRYFTFANVHMLKIVVIVYNSMEQVSNAFGGKSNLDGIGQIVSGIGSLFSGNENSQGIDFSMIGSVLDGVMNSDKSTKRTARSVETNQEHGIDLENIVNMGSMWMSQRGNSELLMGLIPMLLSNLGDASNEVDSAPDKIHDHSGHSWYMPPILENLHVMWDHFSNSELGQTLWKKSGLAQFVGQMSDSEGRIQYEKLLESFENPGLRRRWIRSLTNYIGEWISHISDPQIQQRYLNTVQFVGNSFLKSQGFPKSAMFDSMRPAESLSRYYRIIIVMCLFAIVVS